MAAELVPEHQSNGSERDALRLANAAHNWLELPERIAGDIPEVLNDVAIERLNSLYGIDVDDPEAPSPSFLLAQVRADITLLMTPETQAAAEYWAAGFSKDILAAVAPNASRASGRLRAVVAGRLAEALLAPADQTPAALAKLAFTGVASVREPESEARYAAIPAKPALPIQPFAPIVTIPSAMSEQLAGGQDRLVTGPETRLEIQNLTAQERLDLFGLGGDIEDQLAWQEDALCAQTDPESFFPEKGGSTREAKRVCLSCEVRAKCLEYALANEERFGIWGGLSERERRRVKRLGAPNAANARPEVQEELIETEPAARIDDLVDCLMVDEETDADTIKGLLKEDASMRRDFTEAFVAWYGEGHAVTPRARDQLRRYYGGDPIAGVAPTPNSRASLRRKLAELEDFVNRTIADGFDPLQYCFTQAMVEPTGLRATAS